MKKSILTCCAAAALVFGFAQFSSARQVVVKFQDGINFYDTKGKTLSTFSRPAQKLMPVKQMRELGGKLTFYTDTNLNLEKGQYVKDRFHFHDSNIDKSTAILDVNRKTRSFVYNTNLRRLDGLGDTLGLPFEDEAVWIAEKHLERLGLLTENFDKEKTVAHIGGLRMSQMDDQGKETVFNKLVTVNFGRVLDTFSVKGATRGVVHLGTDGELLGLVWDWPVLHQKELRPAKVIPSKERRSQVVRRLMLFYAQSDVESISVDDVRTVLYDDGDSIIEPAMFATGRILKEDGREYDGDWIIPLLRDPKAAYSLLTTAPVLPGQSNEDRQDKPPVKEDE